MTRMRTPTMPWVMSRKKALLTIVSRKNPPIISVVLLPVFGVVTLRQYAADETRL